MYVEKSTDVVAEAGRRAASLADEVTSALQQERPNEWLEEVLASALLEMMRLERDKCAMIAEHRAVSADNGTESTLDDSLIRIRQRGHWRGPSRQAHGVVDISVPILGPSDAAIAVLTCPYVIRLDDSAAIDEQQTCRLLLQAAESLRVRSHV